jgi:hypothetical protein
VCVGVCGREREADMADAAAETSAAIANDVVRIGSMVSFFNPNVRSHCARGERE